MDNKTHIVGCDCVDCVTTLISQINKKFDSASEQIGSIYQSSFIYYVLSNDDEQISNALETMTYIQLADLSTALDTAQKVISAKFDSIGKKMANEVAA